MVTTKFDVFTAFVDKITDDTRITFFGVFKMDDVTDRWTLLFGMTGVKDLDKRNEVFVKYRDLLYSVIEKSELQDVARIGIFEDSSHIIEDLTKFGEGEDILNQKANGNFIHEGHVFIAR